MVKQFRIFTIVFSLFAASFSVCAESRFTPIRKFSASYIATILLGGGIGAATGTLLTYAEKALVQYIRKHNQIDFSVLKLLICLLGWTLEAEIRNDIIMGLQSDLDAYQIQYKKGLMFKSAWLVSWFAYLKGSCILEV